MRLFKDTVISASKIPEPINVKWENITYTGKNKFFRRLFSTLLTLFFFAICKRRHSATYLLYFSYCDHHHPH